MRLLLAALLLFPALALAQVPAGFPATSLWLSKTALTEGEGVTIYTVVYNSSDTSLSGAVEFLVDGEMIGTKSVSAAPGTSHVLSHTWTATEGAHSFSARLTGNVEDLARTNAGTTTITVSPKPPPPEALTKTVETAGAVQAVIASTTPVVQNIASSTFAQTESIRESAVRALERLASSTTPKPEGEVLGAEDEAVSTPEENAARSFDIGAWIQNIWQALITALLFVARSPLWFYLAVGLVLLLIIMFLKAALQRDRYR